jgi:hypothetical protein
MPGFNGTGPMGMGPMTGGGKGFCGVRGMTHHCYGFHYGRPYTFTGIYGYVPYSPHIGREQEVEFLREEAELLKRELETVEARITQLSPDSK